jgi:hypothetical protein
VALTFKKLILYFSTPDFFFKKQRLLDVQPRLRTWLVFGPMDSGKTTFVKTVVHYQNRLLDKYGISYRNVQFFDVESFVKGLTNDWKTTVLNIFIDDAVFLADSRASMSKNNQLLTQTYFYIRHYVEYYSRQTRLINVFWSAQSVTAIDKRIRDTATLIILKGMTRGSERILREYFFPSIINRMQLIQLMNVIDERFKSYFAVSLQKRFSKLMLYRPEPLAKFEQYGERPELRLRNLLADDEGGQ